MARYHSLVFALAFVAGATPPAAAQSLQRLTVTQLTLGASTSTPQIEAPFDLIVTARVNQRIKRLENVDLPILTDVELLGDEPSTVSSASGSTYTERIRVVAHHSGDITIAPVTLDAIDARDGRPKRYSSNTLTLHVGGAPVDVASTGFDAFGGLLRLLRWLVAIAIVAFVIAVIFVRRRRPYAPAPVVEPEPEPIPIEGTPQDRLRDALTLLRTGPNRGNVLRVRQTVREMAGADEAETLEDVLRRIPAHDVRMRTLLRALERAAFTHEGDFRSAFDDVVRRLEEMT